MRFTGSWERWPVPAAAQDTPPRKTVELADAKGGGTMVSVVGEVTAVDVANRVVSIKGPKGNITDLRVDPRARNLEQVKVGDRVRLTYRVGVALALLKGGDGIREKVESESAARTAAGDKPGAAVIEDHHPGGQRRGRSTARSRSSRSRAPRATWST